VSGAYRLKRQVQVQCGTVQVQAGSAAGRQQVRRRSKTRAAANRRNKPSVRPCRRRQEGIRRTRQGEPRKAGENASAGMVQAVRRCSRQVRVRAVRGGAQRRRTAGSSGIVKPNPRVAERVMQNGAGAAQAQAQEVKAGRAASA
jgi:hypothetical protein